MNDVDPRRLSMASECFNPSLIASSFTTTEQAAAVTGTAGKIQGDPIQLEMFYLQVALHRRS